MSEDPIGFNSGEINHYVYVGNNPLNFNDPSGLFTFNIGGQFQAGGGAGGLNSAGVVFGYSDVNGFQFGTYNTYGGGGHGGVSASYTIEAGFSNNDNINDLSGTAANIGGSGSIGLLTGGVDVVLPAEGVEPTYSFSFGLGAGTPVLTYGYLINTTVNELTSSNGAGNGGFVLPSSDPVQFNDFGSPSLDFGTFAPNNANGGFVLYPNMINNNFIQQVYAK